ncbi:phosphatase [Lithospermum erythrorhizon]|uniref:Phosphatase n=1 Tax=Lithospermum erythrorhizon TaxID=34254 RepID=A0AAV3QSD4_LITER
MQQAQKTAELLLDAKVNTVISSSKLGSIETAKAISQVQEAADCLGADCVPRYVEMKQLEDLNVENILKQSDKGVKGLPLQSGWLNIYEDEVITELWDQSEKAWKYLLNELASESGQGNCVVAVGHPAVLIAMMGHCLNLTKGWLGAFHLDAGSICVVDFPDGPSGRGIVRCINYTAHLGRWSIPITRTTLDDEDFVYTDDP